MSPSDAGSQDNSKSSGSCCFSMLTHQQRRNLQVFNPPNSIPLYLIMQDTSLKCTQLLFSFYQLIISVSLSLHSTSLCFHTLFFNQFILFVYSISFYFSLFQSNHKRSGGESYFQQEYFSLSLSLSLSLRVVCLTKQHYKSNSAAVNRLQN